MHAERKDGNTVKEELVAGASCLAIASLSFAMLMYPPSNDTVSGTGFPPRQQPFHAMPISFLLEHHPPITRGALAFAATDRAFT